MGTCYYIFADELNKVPSETFMKETEDAIRERDSIDEFLLVCVNDSAELAELFKDMDFNNNDTWSSLRILLAPREGGIRGFHPLRLMETFKNRAEPGKTTFDLFCEILEWGPEDFIPPPWLIEE